MNESLNISVEKLSFNFSCMFLNPHIFFQFELLLYWCIWSKKPQRMNFKSILFQKLFWPFTVRKICPSDLKIFANYWPSASNFEKKNWSLVHLFLKVGPNNFGNRMPVSYKPFVTDTCPDRHLHQENPTNLDVCYTAAVQKILTHVP
jgi:hypothetical protein